MLVEMLFLSLSRSCRCLTRKIRNMSYLSKNTSSRVRRHSSDRFARRNFLVPRAYDVRYKLYTRRAPLTFSLLARNTQTCSDSDGPLRYDIGVLEVVPMTKLQVIMSREIGRWPLYTIVIGLGQVSRPSPLSCIMP